MSETCEYRAKQWETTYLVQEQKWPQNTSRSATVENLDAVWLGGRDTIANTYQNDCPKGQSERTPRLGAIAIFVVSTPLKRGIESG